MGNYGSYNGDVTYVNPFIMVDYAENDAASNTYNRFASDIDLETTQNQINIKSNINQRVKDYSLARMFKNMVQDYDGSKDHDIPLYDSKGNLIGYDYIKSPNPANRLPSGIYKNSNGDQIKPYTVSACCKNAIGPNSIGDGPNPDTSFDKKSVPIPIATIVTPLKDILTPIYSDIFKTYDVTVNGINSNTKPFYYDKDYKSKINSLTDAQLDSIISNCANGSMCIKSNYVGLQIKTNDMNQKNIICGSYQCVGQDPKINAEANIGALCNTTMRHICAKKLYDQGCTIMKTDDNGKKYPGWNNSPACKNFGNFYETKIGNNIFYGTPDCACINSQSGYTLLNKPNLNNGDNPYNLTKEKDTDFYITNNDTPYALNVVNYPYNNYVGTDTNNGDGFPGDEDPFCVNMIKTQHGSYLLPKYHTNQLAAMCKNVIILNGITTNDISVSGIKQTNNCGKTAQNTDTAVLAQNSLSSTKAKQTLITEQSQASNDVIKNSKASITQSQASLDTYNYNRGEESKASLKITQKAAATTTQAPATTTQATTTQATTTQATTTQAQATTTQATTTQATTTQKAATTTTPATTTPATTTTTQKAATTPATTTTQKAAAPPEPESTQNAEDNADTQDNADTKPTSSKFTIKFIMLVIFLPIVICLILLSVLLFFYSRHKKKS